MTNQLSTRISKLFKKYFKNLKQFFNPNKFTIYETEVGVKYKHGRYNSNRFNTYIDAVLPFTDVCSSFDCLILNPDFLRNKFTLCGIPITMSPHFRLMEEIETRDLTPESEYISRCRKNYECRTS